MDKLLIEYVAKAIRAIEMPQGYSLSCLDENYNVCTDMAKAAIEAMQSYKESEDKAVDEFHDSPL